MWRRIIATLKQWWTRLWEHGASIAPTAPKVETPTLPTEISEPELGLAAAVPPEYRQRGSLFTYRERIFFRALLEDVGDQYPVFPKVRLADVLWLANELENRKYHSNQLHCKHFDFLLCEKRTYRPLLVIELDDSSHDKYEHRERDEFKDKVCTETGKLWRPRVQQRYPKGFIAEQIHNQIQGTAVERPV